MLRRRNGKEQTMGVIDTAVSKALAIANDASHGYDQGSRWGPDYDCSSFLITVWQETGVPVKSGGATYTGNMKRVFLANGFRDVTASVNRSSGSGLQKGDVMLNEASHTAMCIGDGQIVHASINELGRVTGGQKGDQTGKEICVRSYYNKPWDCVLRYTGGSGTATVISDDGILRYGDAGVAVAEMQEMLIMAGYSCGSCGADGEFGTDTKTAVMAMQRDYGLEVDGEYGPISKAKLEEITAGKATGTMTYGKGQTYTLQAEMMVRTGPGTNYRAKTHGELTADGQAHDSDGDGALDAGTRITCLAYQIVGSDIWIQAPSGWIAGVHNGNIYIK